MKEEASVNELPTDEMMERIKTLPDFIPDPTQEEIKANNQSWVDRSAPNCINYWYPKLQEIGIRTPRTVIANLGQDLTLWAWGEAVPGLSSHIERVRLICQEIGYPCFLRSGQTSAKHDWKNSCYLTDDSDLPKHMYAIVEYCAMAGMEGLPVSVFAARELIPTTPICNAFYGDMPITREFRFFVKDGSIDHWQPYWPQGALDGNVDITKFDECTETDTSWMRRLETINHLDGNEYELLASETLKVGKHFGGYWSVDWLQATDGTWYCIDMALGGMSYRYDPETGEQL